MLMIKIIIPIDEDTLDGVAALLKMELKKTEERESLYEDILGLTLIAICRHSQPYHVQI